MFLTHTGFIQRCHYSNGNFYKNISNNHASGGEHYWSYGKHSEPWRRNYNEEKNWVHEKPCSFPTNLFHLRLIHLLMKFKRNIWSEILRRKQQTNVPLGFGLASMAANRYPPAAPGTIRLSTISDRGLSLLHTLIWPQSRQLPRLYSWIIFSWPPYFISKPARLPPLPLSH